MPSLPVVSRYCTSHPGCQVRVAIPECGCMPKPNPGVTSASKKSRNIKGLSRSPSPSGLMRRVIGPCLTPWLRLKITELSNCSLLPFEFAERSPAALTVPARSCRRRGGCDSKQDWRYRVRERFQFRHMRLSLRVLEHRLEIRPVCPLRVIDYGHAIQPLMHIRGHKSWKMHHDIFRDA